MVRSLTILAFVTLAAVGCDNHSGWTAQRQVNCNQFTYVQKQAKPAFEAAALLLQSEGTDQERCERSAAQLRRGYVLVREVLSAQRSLATAGDRPRGAKLGHDPDLAPLERVATHLAECQQAETGPDGRPAEQYRPSKAWLDELHTAADAIGKDLDEGVEICQATPGITPGDWEFDGKEVLADPVDPATVKVVADPPAIEPPDAPTGNTNDAE